MAGGHNEITTGSPEPWLNLVHHVCTRVLDHVIFRQEPGFVLLLLSFTSHGRGQGAEGRLYDRLLMSPQPHSWLLHKETELLKNIRTIICVFINSSDQRFSMSQPVKKSGRENTLSTMATTATPSKIKSYCVVKNRAQVLLHRCTSLKLLLKTVN